MTLLGTSFFFENTYTNNFGRRMKHQQEEEESEGRGERWRMRPQRPLPSTTPPSRDEEWGKGLAKHTDTREPCSHEKKGVKRAPFFYNQRWLYLVKSASKCMTFIHFCKEGEREHFSEGDFDWIWSDALTSLSSSILHIKYPSSIQEHILSTYVCIFLSPYMCIIRLKIEHNI